MFIVFVNAKYWTLPLYFPDIKQNSMPYISRTIIYIHILIENIMCNVIQ